MKRYVWIAGLLVALTVVTHPWTVFGQTTGNSPIDNPHQTPPPEDPGRPAMRAHRISENAKYGMTGVISGRVTYADGTPAPGFTLAARFQMHQTGMQGEGDAITDSSGRYEIHGLGSQHFFVGVSNFQTPYLAPKEVPVDLSTVRTKSGVDFVLNLGPKVTVKVHDAETRLPIPGMVVTVDGNGYDFGKTDAKGEVQFRMNALGLNLHIEDPDKNRDYGPAPGYTPYRQAQPSDTKGFEWDVLCYQHPYENRPAVFRGMVIDEGGATVRGAEVRLIRYGETHTTRSDSLGQFKFETTRIAAYEDEKGAAVLMADDHSFSATKVVKAKETWGAIKLVLKGGNNGEAEGRVVDEHGNPIPGCWITYWEFFNSTAQPSVQPSNGGRSDESGHFLVTGLRPGASYHFSFGDHYDKGDLGRTLYPANAMDGHYLTVNSGERKELGTIVVFLASKTVSGTIVDTAGNPVTKNVLIHLKGDHTSVTGYPDKEGKFTLTAVPNEPVTLRVFVGDGHFYRTADNSPDLLLTKPVTPSDSSLKLVVKMRKPIG